MNTNAYKTNRNFYKNTRNEKGVTDLGNTVRFYKNPEKDRRFITPSMCGNSANEDTAVYSVIKLFSGTIVSLDAGTVQWHCGDLFP